MAVIDFLSGNPFYVCLCHTLLSCFSPLPSDFKLGFHRGSSGASFGLLCRGPAGGRWGLFFGFLRRAGPAFFPGRPVFPGNPSFWASR
jgi:hypothetical protein